MQNKSLEFEGGGLLMLTETEEGLTILFQAPYMEDQFRITSMNAQLTKEQAIELAEWILKLGGTKVNE
jgi:hypothetical protein